jgi:hypothetical protein
MADELKAGEVYRVGKQVIQAEQEEVNRVLPTEQDWQLTALLVTAEDHDAQAASLNAGLLGQDLLQLHALSPVGQLAVEQEVERNALQAAPVVMHSDLQEDGQQGLVQVAEQDALHVGSTPEKLQSDIQFNHEDNELEVVHKELAPFTKQLQKAILTSPATVKPARKPKGKENLGSNTKEMTDSKRRSVRLANKPKSNLTMEEQATQLLMKKSGTLEADCDGGTIDKFAHQFTEPMKNVDVKDYRVLFDFPEVGETDPLHEEVLEAEC